MLNSKAMRVDPWLDRWLPLVRERAGNQAILELGCGTGRDTATLMRAGHRVIAIDRSRPSLLAARIRAPRACVHCRNILDPFPVGPGECGIVLASLSLHYFPWVETELLVQRIRETLRPAGVLLCRLNSTSDSNFGAIGNERLDENYYSVNGQPKRFFDRAAVDRLFADGWVTLSVEEATIDRYALPKRVWEVIVERDA